MGYFSKSHPCGTAICCAEKPAAWRARHLLPPVAASWPCRKPMLGVRGVRVLWPTGAGWNQSNLFRGWHVRLRGRSSVLCAQTHLCTNEIFPRYSKELLLQGVKWAGHKRLRIFFRFALSFLEEGQLSWKLREERISLAQDISFR